MLTKALRAALLALLTVTAAAAATLTAAPASAAIDSVETWQVDPWQKVTQVSAGQTYRLVSVMIQPLQTYGWVWFYDNGTLVSTGYPNYGASDIQPLKGRYVALSPYWTPAAGTHNIEARQCGDSACGYRVQIYKTTITVN
ncbi:hypothetical protein ACFXPR_15595 [Nocardia tengchongensis]|uniref:hypothetical protein n=1 Tax=Nocardia tengchongensis TaxID=2055889 RepID=UPI0036D0AB62